MALPRYPLKAVFPLIVATRDGLARLFLGTGFFIRGNGTFLTAKHVLDGVTLGNGESFAAVILPGGPTAHPISDVRFAEQFDIALARVEGVDDVLPLEIATEDAPINRDVLTVEFSGTESRPLEDGRTAMHFTPYYRKGHVICSYPSTYPEAVPTVCHDLSFPALRGASGAPVIVEADGSVTGMVVANVERHLLPAQVERVELGSDQREEIRYFLPTGKAIAWQHLREFVQSVLGDDTTPSIKE
jgi:hypothetical protein